MVVTPYEGLFIYGPEDPRSRMLVDLGFEFPTDVFGGEGEEFGTSLSAERTSDLDKIDVAVWLDLEADPAVKKVFDQTTTAARGPLVRHQRRRRRLLRRPQLRDAAEHPLRAGALRAAARAAAVDGDPATRGAAPDSRRLTRSADYTGRRRMAGPRSGGRCAGRRGRRRRGRTRPPAASTVNTSRGGPCGDDRAVLHHDDQVAVAGRQVEVVQHHHDGAAALAVEPGDQVEHLDLVGEVEEGRRLVEQQQVGVLGQRHRDPGPLPLAAGELVEGPVAQVAGVGHLQRGLDDLLVVGRPLAEPALVRVPAAADQVADQQAVGRDRALGEQREPTGDLAGRTRRRSASPSSRTLPPARLEQPGQGAQQRRLAAAVGPDDRWSPGRREGRG